MEELNLLWCVCVYGSPRFVRTVEVRTVFKGRDIFQRRPPHLQLRACEMELAPFVQLY